MGKIIAMFVKYIYLPWCGARLVVYEQAWRFHFLFDDENRLSRLHHAIATDVTLRNICA